MSSSTNAPTNVPTDSPTSSPEGSGPVWVPGQVIGGVDTHGRTHHAAVLDHLGRRLADQQFPATTAGYRDLLAWLGSYGRVAAVGVEGTGAFGAELTRMLTAAGVRVVEVDRPDRAARRRSGKSDPLDAYSAAHAVVAGRAAGVPKARTGQVESVRVLRVARASAIQSRTQVMNQVKAILVSAPGPLRELYSGLNRVRLIRALAGQRLSQQAGAAADPTTATKIALRHLARRYLALNQEAADLDALIAPLVAAVAPDLLQRFGVGPDTAGQLLATAGDNPDRLRSEAAFAHLCGVAPIPASSGRSHRHRLNRGGDRAANRALHTIVLARMHYDPRTRAYVARRTSQGLSKRDIIRCLKRFVAREIYHCLTGPVGHTGRSTPAGRQTAREQQPAAA